MAVSLFGRVVSGLLNVAKNDIISISSCEASKKAGGSTKNKLKNTRGKRRGWKKYDGDYVEAGMIVMRQLGLRVYPGENVGCGRDYTLFALQPGMVYISKEELSPYPDSPLFEAVESGRKFEKYFFHVVPEEPQRQVFRLVSHI